MLTTPDHADVRGIFWTSNVNPNPRVVVMASHPRADFSFHHTFPDLLRAGYGCLGGNLRTLNNDMNCIHESLIVDIATYARWLKEERGVKRIVLLGNSGGGSLFSFYQSQAKTPPSSRIDFTPGGKSTGLDNEELIVADGLIFLAAHTGQGLVLNETIDPAVIDEHQPLLTDPTLDMYDPGNNFRPPPQWVEYSSEFVERYRSAQLDRVRRLDSIALEMIAENTRAHALRMEHTHEALADDVERQLQVREAFEPIMIVYRTMANLHYVDRRLDPSERSYGSLFGDRPDIMNYRHRGFARIVTPHGWLSTWSGLSSNANIPTTATLITEPALVINAGRDRDVYPLTHSRKIFDALASVDKEYWEFPDAQHYFEPEQETEGNQTLDALMARLVPWIEERFPL
jgi:pimeloyl-ACP methyl ester carboxylesterase